MAEIFVLMLWMTGTILAVRWFFYVLDYYFQSRCTYRGTERRN